MILLQSKFLQYQNVFYQKVVGTPYKITLETFSVEPPTSSGFDLASFVGDSSRDSVSHEFNALYEKEIPNRVREKYGIAKEVNGVVYLSPKQLVPIYGTFKLDWNKTIVHFEESIQVIDKIVYLEQLYNSCIGVQIFIKDKLKA